MHTLKAMYADGTMDTWPCYEIHSSYGSGNSIVLDFYNGKTKIEVELYEGDVAFLMAGSQNVHTFRVPSAH